MTYDNVTSLPANSAVAYVDMAGNSPLRATLHRHFGEQMKYSGLIGLTHRKSSPDERAQVLPGAKPTIFLRAGPDPQARQGMGTGRRRAAVWRGVVRLRAEARPMAEGEREPRACGGEAVYLDTLNGRVPPDQGHILSLAA